MKERPRLRSAKEKRAERERLGFLRQPAVRWLDPGILAREAVQVAVSYAFGKFADKRELQLEPQPVFDFSEEGELDRREELWLDFLSDTGDGWEATQTMAWLLAQPELPGPDGRALPRGDLLLLGGDQVYPSASPEAYEDRFVGPFGAASPRPESRRLLFAIPGNHDWYDGLASFLRVFCRPEAIGRKAIGGWDTRQTRSYWALALGRRWWLWALDIQLDTYIDNPQLEYFRAAGDRLRPGDQVILITAKPSWVKVEPDRPEPQSWRYLTYFEREMIGERGARLVLTLTGDLHHYSRYEPEAGQGPVRVTAGGGGAYLSPTHVLRDPLALRPAPDEEPVAYRRHRVYPSEGRSRRLRWGILKLPLMTPAFAVVIGVVYALIAATFLGSLNASGAGIVAAGTADGVSSFLDGAVGAGPVLAAILLAALLAAYADFRTWAAKLPVGIGHAGLHVMLCAGALYAILLAFSPGVEGWVVWLVGLAACIAVGFLLGTFIFAAVILTIHLLRGPKAPKHTNEVFAGQAIADYKNFLRLHLDRDGRLTVYPLGVERVSREWTLREDREWVYFEPRGEPPRVTPIDGPLTFPPPD